VILEAECLAQLEADWLAVERSRLAALPKAKVLEFPEKLAEAERERQVRVAEQDWARTERRRMEMDALSGWSPLRLTPQRYRELCDATWQANMDQKAEEERRRSRGFHKGVGDPDL
jgi:hypothetical protein